ncbi:MAG: hypothetical protein JSR82_00895 [Verrucomicrobia bacterium]|nr:hypothetical protein [Verrucomicrobiota bacterium]
MISRQPAEEPVIDPSEVEGRDLTYEEHVQLRRRRWLRIYLPILAVLIVGIVVGGLPAWRAVKAFHARRIAAEAKSLLEQGKMEEARNRALDAYKLAFVEPAVIRANAQIHSRRGRGNEAMHFWRELEKLKSLTIEDRRDFAATALSAGDLESAGRMVDSLNASGQPPKPIDALLNAQVAAGRSDFTKAQEWARKVVAPDSKNTERERYLAAMLLVSMQDPEGRVLGLRQVTALARTDHEVALEALVFEARRSRSGSNADGLGSPEIIQRLESHPKAEPVHKLLALDVRARVDPLRKEEFIQQAIREYGKPENKEALAKLVVWLNEKREHERVLQLVTFDRSLGSSELFLGRLDALGALDRWNEVRQALESQRFPLDPIIQELYLARALAQMGDKVASDNRWLKARQATNGATDKLLVVARYAERAGNFGAAEAAYRQVAETSPEIRPLQETFLRFLSENGDTPKVHRQIRAMLRIWPQDPSLQNDDAYLSALRNESLEAALATAERLVAASPTSLPHRTTLALARLRLGRNADALQTFRNLNIPENVALPNTRLIHAMALQSCGFGIEARAEASRVPRTKLRAEERVLLDQILSRP